MDNKKIPRMNSSFDVFYSIILITHHIELYKDES